MEKIIEGTVKVHLAAYNEGVTSELVVLCDGLTGEQIIEKLEDSIADNFENVYIKNI